MFYSALLQHSGTFIRITLSKNTTQDEALRISQMTIALPFLLPLCYTDGKGGELVRKKRIKIVLLVLCTALVLAAVLSLVLSRYALSVSEYTVSSERIEAPMRVVQLSDLHNCTFGKGNARLIGRILALEPDIVVMTGDMCTCSVEDVRVPLALTEELSKHVPVYFAMGNHEISHEEHFSTDLQGRFQAAGATVLDDAFLEIECNGNDLRIGGWYGYCLKPTSKVWIQEEQDFLSAFGDTERFRLLLSHHPEGTMLWGGIDEREIELVLSGHIHGGVVRLPWIGALYAPDQGWFPECTEGMMEGAGGAAILSRGLGTGTFIPRFCNVPEIVCVDLVPEETL